MTKAFGSFEGRAYTSCAKAAKGYINSLFCPGLYSSPIHVEFSPLSKTRFRAFLSFLGSFSEECRTVVLETQELAKKLTKPELKRMPSCKALPLLSS